jgi:hypothetical protein
MDNIKRFETISDYNLFNNNETLHPLVSVVDLSKADGVSTWCFHILNSYWSR